MNIIKTGEEMKEGGKEVKDEEIHVAILANLQQIQDQEAEILLRDLSEKVSEAYILPEGLNHFYPVSHKLTGELAILISGMITSTKS